MGKKRVLKDFNSLSRRQKARRLKQMTEDEIAKLLDGQPETLNCEFIDMTNFYDGNVEIKSESEGQNDMIEIAGSSTCSCCQDCRTRIEKRLDLLTEKIIDVKLMIQKLPSKLSHAFSIYQDIGDDLLPNFPIDNWLHFLELEENLQKNKNCFQQLKQKMKKIGGSSYTNFTNKLLALLLTNELAKGISWTGNSRSSDGSIVKINKFDGTITSNMICTVIIEHYRNFNMPLTEDKIQTVIKNWLRHAGDRCANKA